MGAAWDIYQSRFNITLSNMIGLKSLLALVALWHTASACRIADKTNFLGNDIGYSFEDTWEDCAKACKNHKGCLYFTYAKKTYRRAPRKCHFKDKITVINRGDASLISGDIACANPIPPQACRLDNDIDYLGCDIGSSTEPTWRACAIACEQTAGCEFFTWGKPTSDVPNKCHYKNSKCGKVKSDPRFISGNKACGTPCQVETFTDYRGCDIGMSKERNWIDCAKKCGKTNGCKFFTYVHELSDIYPRSCFLKDKKCNVTPGKSFLLSGNRACATAPYLF